MRILTTLQISTPPPHLQESIGKHHWKHCVPLAVIVDGTIKNEEQQCIKSHAHALGSQRMLQIGAATMQSRVAFKAPIKSRSGISLARHAAAPCRLRRRLARKGPHPPAKKKQDYSATKEHACFEISLPKSSQKGSRPPAKRKQFYFATKRIGIVLKFAPEILSEGVSSPANRKQY